jgi:hypothetical protein
VRYKKFGDDLLITGHLVRKTSTGKAPDLYRCQKPCG